jgi:FkbH-like protein
MQSTVIVQDKLPIVSRRDLLKESALNRLASLLAAVDKAARAKAAWRAEARIHFLRNFTTEPLDPYLAFHLMRDDIRPTITHGGYGTAIQELLGKNPDNSEGLPDVLVLSQLVEFLDPSVARKGWVADAAVAELSAILHTLIDRSSAVVVANSFIAPIDQALEYASPGIQRGIDQLNDALRAFADRHPDRIFICDWSSASAGIAVSKLLDMRFWRSSQAPFRPLFLDRYARQIASFVRASVGLARKLLILDCDNTLWGGVVGEEGLSGIQLTPDGVPGQYYYRVQKRVVELHREGVMIALCSKNNEEDVWEVLDKHPHAPLQKSHLVGWRIDWNDKASNIDSLVRELNIGMDAVVFVDDNPRELALIAQRLPDVTLLEVPEDLSLYEHYLLRDGWFQTITQSEEDRQRTRMYQEENARSEAQQLYQDLDDYLESLKTVARIGPIDDGSVSRVAQLTQKTNQFNLTTHRYSEADIRAFAADPDAAVYMMTVQDRFGDMGKTGVLIARREGHTAVIDTLLLSCRILGRRLEIAFVDQCMQALQWRWAPADWRAEYIATRKNQQTGSFWKDIGFRIVEDDESHKTYAADSIPEMSDYGRIITVELE